MEDQISKKELLELMDISYGQLYRWKRKGLIPEEWFIRKATYTGQETFFPKLKVLQRIERIKSMKDDISLDDLADVFSPDPGTVSLAPEELVKRNIVPKEAMGLYLDVYGTMKQLGLREILLVYILGRFLASGEISLEESRQLLGLLGEGFARFGEAACEICLTRKLGVFGCMMLSPPCEVCLDSGQKLIGHINTADIIEELKLKLV